MLGFLCKRPLPIRRLVRDSAVSQLGFLQIISPINPFSSAAESEQKQSFTVSYLTNSCGLSLERAKFISEKTRFQSPEKPDSVLALLRNHGFTNTHISKLVRIRPNILLADPERTLLPKLEFYRSIGFSSTDLPNVISSNPKLLTHSLENHIIPFYNFMKSVVLVDEKVVSTLKGSSRILEANVGKKIAPNIGVLRDLGVPESSISSLITCHPGALSQKHDEFKKCVKEVIKMGFDTSKVAFVNAVHVTAQIAKSTWEHKLEVYRRWGWSENDLRTAFRAHPICMSLSENKIMSGMDFFVNKMGWESAAIAKNPTVLFLNLEKRIIPRFSVIQVLLSKGLIKKDFSLATVLQPPEKHFLVRYVTKYQEDVPQLLSIYQGKMSLSELGFGFEHGGGMKQK